MAVNVNFTQADVKARFDRVLSVIEARQIQCLQYLGEMCVTHARELPASVGFGDVTGNLRSSIGYVVFKDGVAIHQNYVITKDGGEGASKGKALAESVRKPKGIVLVVTAGMNYAVAVESKGKDVITSAESLAITEMPRMLEQLKQAINNATSR